MVTITLVSVSMHEKREYCFPSVSVSNALLLHSAGEGGGEQFAVNNIMTWEGGRYLHSARHSAVQH